MNLKLTTNSEKNRLLNELRVSRQQYEWGEIPLSLYKSLCEDIFKRGVELFGKENLLWILGKQ